MPADEAPPGERFRFALAAAVRKSDATLRNELDHVLVTHAKEVDRILAACGVPRL